MTATNSAMHDIAIYGAGGFGMEVAWLIQDINRVEPTWNLLGFIDDDETKLRKSFYGLEVIGGFDFFETLEGPVDVAVAIGNTAQRSSIVGKLQRFQVNFPTLVHPSVIYAPDLEIGAGSIIAAGSVLTVEIKIGNHVHIDTSCTIGHETRIHDYSRLNPRVTVAGKVNIDEEVYVGSGATIIQGLKIGHKAVIGSGAVVVKTVQSGTVVIGNPARPI